MYLSAGDADCPLNVLLSLMEAVFVISFTEIIQYGIPISLYWLVSFNSSTISINEHWVERGLSPDYQCFAAGLGLLNEYQSRPPTTT